MSRSNPSVFRVNDPALQVAVHSQYGIAHLGPFMGSPVNSYDAAEDVKARAERESVTGIELYRSGNYERAVVHFAEAVKLQPNHATHYLHLASATWRLGNLENVNALFSAALSLEPNSPVVHEMMAAWFMQQGDIAKSIEHSALAVKLAPRRLPAKIAHVEALWADGQFDAAWELLQPVVAAGAGGHCMALAYAKVADRVGRQADAIATIDRELRTPGLLRADAARMLFAAAGLADALGQYDSAFEYAWRGNETDRRPCDPETNSRHVSERIQYYTQAQLNSLPRATRDSSRSVLIVGMPRSGTSLVEQILASHPAVHGGGELRYLYDAVIAGERAPWSKGELFPRCWNHLSVNRANELAGRYLDRIDALSKTATYVTDKMPTNFLYLGTAELLLPNCKVIHCVRDPRDTCLSCYFADFAVGHDFSFDLAHLASYYRDYVRLMDHWKKVLKLQILDVRYEDVIADPAGQSRRMLDFLNLPWDDRCLNFHKNKRHIATSSRDHVRRPIYTSSVERWKNYQKHIPELMGLVKE